MNTVPTFPISKAEFYRFVVANEGQGRFEYVRGHIVQQMRGRTRRHGCVAMAICQSTWSQVDRDRWTCLPDRGVETSETIRYPDLVVEPADEPDVSLSTQRPAVVVEIVSPSSRLTDLAEKPEEYLSLETLHAYIVAEQDAPTWRVWQRGEDGAFPAEPTLLGADDTVTIPALGVTLGIAAILADAR